MMCNQTAVRKNNNIGHQAVQSGEKGQVAAAAAMAVVAAVHEAKQGGAGVMAAVAAATGSCGAAEQSSVAAAKLRSPSVPPVCQFLRKCQGMPQLQKQ